MKILTNNYEETQKEGEKFAHTLRGGDVIFLYGDLGSGKTTFMQGLAKGLGITHRIISPTFIIMRTYEVPGVILGSKATPESSSKKDSGQARMTVQKLYHIDLYRTATRHDLEGLGLFDILGNEKTIVAIEWPEKFGTPLPEKRYEIRFETVSEDTRSITIEKIGK